MSFTLSLTGKRWIIARSQPAGSDISKILERERGIIASPGKLSDPFLFTEMGKAIERLKKAIASCETIGIFGDYDADGITGTAQLVHMFQRHGIEPVVHLPHRAEEGYGMKIKSVDELKKKGVTLLLTVDTGIAAHKEIAHAAELGIDTIVTDHHRPQGGRPPAFAVIHPEIPGTFPNAHLSGSGVAFMLVRALEDGKPWDGIDRDIVLATIGTIGDVVPLTGENRTLVLHGLKRAKSLPASALKDFIDAVCTAPQITSGDVAFRIVPRINAAGRMAHPGTALKALLEGGEALESLHMLNGERQELVEALMEQALKVVDQSKSFLSIFSSTFTPGTVGLIAGRLSETFGKPSIAGAKVGDVISASLRSIPSVDLMDCLNDPSVSSLLTTFGGHAQAAGCTFPAANAEKLSAALNAALESQDLSFPLLPTVMIDAELSHGTFTVPFIRSLLSLEPFGAGNEEPMFLIRSCTLTDIRTVGSESSHLQCKISTMKAIGFRQGALIEHLSSNKPVDIACRFGMNHWNGREEPQILIEDIRISE